MKGNNNTLNYSAAQQSLNVLKNLAEEVRTNLNNINNLITQNVNTGDGLWDGNSASNFLNNWGDVAKDIPTYITYLENQVENLSEFIKEISTPDETNL